MVNARFTNGQKSSSRSLQFISLLFSRYKKLDDQIRTMSEKGMQVTKRIDVKHYGYVAAILLEDTLPPVKQLSWNSKLSEVRTSK